MAKDKKEIEKFRQKQHVEMMSFSRFMLFRYVAAFFFFFNLYWLVLLIQAEKKTWILPLLLMVAILPMLWEHFKKLHDLSNQLKQSKIYFWLQMAVNLVLIGMCFTPAYSAFYPFMHIDEKGIVTGLLLFGVLVCFYMERRAYQIENNKDKYYQRLKRAEEAAQRNIKKLNE